MNKEPDILEEVTLQDYKYGFVTDIEQETSPKGLNESTVQFISAKKKVSTARFPFRWQTGESKRFPTANGRR